MSNETMTRLGVAARRIGQRLMGCESHASTWNRKVSLNKRFKAVQRDRHCAIFEGVHIAKILPQWRIFARPLTALD